MVTDAQSLLALGNCYLCFGPNFYTLELMELALLAKWQALVANGWFIFASPLVSPNTAAAHAGAPTGLSTFNHGLPGTPQLIYPVFVNQIIDRGFSVGDEMAGWDAMLINTPLPSAQVCTANPVSVTTGFYSQGVNPDTIWHKTIGSSVGTMTSANWMLKVYCAFFGPGGVITPKTFIQSGIVLASSATSFNHGLPKTPQIVLAYLDCNVADAGSGMNPGDSKRIEEVIDERGGIKFPAVMIGANSTTLFINQNRLNPGNELNVRFWQRGTNSTNISPTSFNNFTMRLVAMAF